MSDRSTLRPNAVAVETIAAANAVPQRRATIAGHLQIARVDHWVKNVFVIPGVISALSLDPAAQPEVLLTRLVVGLFVVGIVASSNYTLNELIDAPFDRHHPSKRLRPVPLGRVNIPVAYAQWLLLGAAGLVLALWVGHRFAATMAALWLMGCVYNIPPVRTKDVPHLDVLSEAMNNPLRMLAGWYIVSRVAIPPATLLVSYWMVGCYFMAIKRYAERRQFGDEDHIAAYRKSLARLTPDKLLIGITFYGSAAMLFFGAFIMRYRLELILTFPLVALVMALYLELAFHEQSAAQHPEMLYREPKLMLAVVACTTAMTVLFFVHLPWLHTLVSPTVGAAGLRTAPGHW